MTFFAESVKSRASQPDANGLLLPERNTNKSHSISGCKPGNSSQTFAKKEKCSPFISVKSFIDEVNFLKKNFPQDLYYNDSEYINMDFHEGSDEKAKILSYFEVRRKIKLLFQKDKVMRDDNYAYNPRNEPYLFLATNLSLEIARVDFLENHKSKPYGKDDYKRIKEGLNKKSKETAYSYKKEKINEALREIHIAFFPEDNIKSDKNMMKELVGKNYKLYEMVLKALREQLNKSENLIKTNAPERIDLNQFISRKNIGAKKFNLSGSKIF